MKKKLLLLFILFPILLFGIASSYDLDGAVGFWTLNENDASSTTIFDKFGNNGVSTNSPVFIKDQNNTPNSAQVYNGTSDKVTFGNVGNIKTFGIWIYPTAHTRSIADFDGGTISVEIDASSDITATGWTAPTIYVGGLVGTAITLNDWNYISVTSATAVNASALVIGNEATWFAGNLSDHIVYSDEKSSDFIYSQHLAGQTTAGDVADGSNALNNGDFSSWDGGANPNNFPIGWTLLNNDATNYVEDSNGCHFIIAGSFRLRQAGALTIGRIYKIDYEITQYTSGELRITTGGSTTLETSLGIYSFEITATSTELAIRATTAPVDMSLDNVVVTDITAAPVATLSANLAFDMPSTVPNTRSGDNLVVSSCENDDGLPFDTFTGATASGFTAIAVSGVQTYLCGTADEIVFEDGKNYVTSFTAVINSGTIQTNIASNIGGSSISETGGQTLASGENDFIFTSNTSTTGVVIFSAADDCNFVISNLTFKELNATTLDLSANANHGTVSGATVTYDGLVNVVAGLAYVPTTAIERWEFNLNTKNGGNSNVQFISLTNTKFNDNNSGYLISLNTSITNAFEFYSYESLSKVVYTANSYITGDTPYRILITRTPVGVFTFYIKGGSFGWDDWTLIDVSGGGGTNPYTSLIHTVTNYFVFDLDADDNISDLHINGKPISLSDATQSTGTWTTTKPSYYYDGSNVITVPSSFNSVFVGDFTISMWLQPDDGIPASNQFFYGNYVDATGRLYLQNSHTSGLLKFKFEANNDSEYIESNSAVFPNGATEWTHVTITGDQSVAELKMYINGVIEPTTTTDVLTSANWALYNSTTNEYFIGATVDSSGSFEGYEAHGRIWGELRSTTEIMQEYLRKKHIYQ